MDFFDEPYKIVPVYVETSIKLVDIGLNDQPIRREKKYIKQKMKIRFTNQIGDNRSWSQKCLDAIANFVALNDVYMNRTRIIEASFPNRSHRYEGYVWIECYMLERKNV